MVIQSILLRNLFHFAPWRTSLIKLNTPFNGHVIILKVLWLKVLTKHQSTLKVLKHISNRFPKNFVASPSCSVAVLKQFKSFLLPTLDSIMKNVLNLLDICSKTSSLTRFHNSSIPSLLNTRQNQVNHSGLVLKDLLYLLYLTSTMISISILFNQPLIFLHLSSVYLTVTIGNMLKK